MTGWQAHPGQSPSYAREPGQSPADCLEHRERPWRRPQSDRISEKKTGQQNALNLKTAVGCLLKPVQPAGGQPHPGRAAGRSAGRRPTDPPICAYGSSVFFFISANIQLQGKHPLLDSLDGQMPQLARGRWPEVPKQLAVAAQGGTPHPDHLRKIAQGIWGV